MMQNRTMPDESCQPYLAQNMECSPVCTNCDRGAPALPVVTIASAMSASLTFS